MKPATFSASERQGAMDYLDYYSNALKGQATIDKSSDSTFLVSTFGGDKKIEMILREVEYTDSQGSKYRQMVVVRAPGDKVYALSYAALISDFSDAEWRDLTASTQLYWIEE